MEERIGDTQWQFQITHTLLASFALLALVLAIATVGVYGVISHAVNLRVREFGICMAMGATPADVMHQVDYTEWTISSVKSGHLKSVICGQSTSVLTSDWRGATVILIVGNFNDS